MHMSATWVLVANERDAVICTNDDGVSRLLQVISRKHVLSTDPEARRRAFCWQLMIELFRGAQRQAFDGLVIIAPDEMLRELRRIAMPEIRQLLVAEIPAADSATLEIPFALVDDTVVWSAA